MLEDKTELLAEYENINDKGSAKIKNDNEILFFQTERTRRRKW